MLSDVSTTKASDPTGKGVCGSEPFRSGADRLAYRQEQFAAREWLREDLSHPELARHIAGGTRTSSESRGEKQYRTAVLDLDRLDNFPGAPRHRNVDDDEVRFISCTSGFE